jgi:predicted NAD/FAD-binding protein
LADANAAETSALGAVGYQPNHVVLHSDASVMPRKKQVWSSWNYTEAAGKRDDQIDLTYWMNKLQPLETEQDFFVTLNSTRKIDPSLIWDEVVLRHPVYDAAALASQDTVKSMNGANKTWFCGAWLNNGFHEDGIMSAVEVVEAMRAAPAWAAAE